MVLSNIAHMLTESAQHSPDQTAVVFTSGYQPDGKAIYTRLSFEELNALCDRYAHGISDYGIHTGDRVMMLVPPGIDMIGITFALIKIGAVPVMIDPGMKRRAFLRCVLDTQPTAFIGIPKAHLLRILYPSAFKTITHPIIVGRHSFFGTPTIESLSPAHSMPFEAVTLNPQSEAAVAFTSGGTGIPKGVIFRQEMFQAQFELLHDEIGIQPGEVDLPGLSIFALFGPALGLSEIFPDMDPTHPAALDPAKLVQTIQDYGVTNSFGSPIIWRKVAAYCLPRKIRLPSIKRILMAGAPVPPTLIEDYTHILDGGEIYTPYGATEALPLTMMSGTEILEETAALSAQGHGMCVGRPVSKATIRIIHTSDDIIPEWSEALCVPQGVVGEITAKGPMVTREYLNRPDQTAHAKIYEGDQVWHRMGDLGYYDEQGRIWFCGRKTHRIETAQGLVLPVPCEAIFNAHPGVFRTALVGIGDKGRQTPVLVVEARPGKQPHGKIARNTFQQELLALGAQHRRTRAIHQVLFYPKTFPVDVRHNAKIDRLALGRWAAGKLKVEK